MTAKLQTGPPVQTSYDGQLMRKRISWWRPRVFPREMEVDISPPHHPLDPLSAAEIEHVVSVIAATYGTLSYNTVTLHEPPKAELLVWLAEKMDSKRPARQAEVTAIDKEGKVFDGLVDIAKGVILEWERVKGAQPIITMEDLIATEVHVRKDSGVIEQCGILGIPPEDMHKVYCDPWTIGYDSRFGNSSRLQQGLLYYRDDPDDCQYTHPLDFCPIINTETGKVIHIDIPAVRRPLNKIKSNYNPKDIEALGGYRKDIKPLNITQPEGVDFTMDNNVISWQGFKFHIGFNHREGIVLSDMSFNDKGEVRNLFYRMSLAEMVVPYGNPEQWHFRKHAFDLGEYGGGYMANSLALGCDCKGAIHYLSATFPNRAGAAIEIPNAICIHTEDSGILFKHTDYRDNSLIVTRGRKLVVSQIFTAANYEYCIYWIFHMDGTIQLEIKLTGILNTYAMHPDEDTKGWGTQVHPGVNAHNHQHLFCLRLNPRLDGDKNTIFQVDSAQGAGEVGSAENPHGNAFYALKTKYKTVREGVADYEGSTTRTWDIVNENRIHPYSGKPSSYKLVSRECPKLLIKEGGLVWKRAGFARHNIHVTKYKDYQFYPAGRHVPQTSGEPSAGLPQWREETLDESIENEDIVLWHTFGLTHFPAPEDFPVMPVEPFSLLLRPRHFFKRNPVLDVPPSFSSTPSQVRNRGQGVLDASDKMSRLAFEDKKGDGCCGKEKGIGMGGEATGATTNGVNGRA